MKSKVISLKINAWMKEHQGKHFCKCGCGGVIKILEQHWHRGIPQRLQHHGNRKERIRKKCKCGKLFIVPPSLKESKFCSARCRTRFYSSKAIIKIDNFVLKHQGKHFCKKCGKELKIKRHYYHDHAGIPRYCRGHSTFIHLLGRRCLTCGKSFSIKKGRELNGRGRFCSNKCGVKFNSKLQEKKTELICIICKKPFKVHQYLKGRQKCCSSRCASIFIGKNNRRNQCKVCGEAIDYKNRKRRGAFCEKHAVLAKRINSLNLSKGLTGIKITPELIRLWEVYYNVKEVRKNVAAKKQ